MATNPPVEQIQRVVLDLPAWKLVLTAAAIISTLATGGALYLNKSLDTMEAKLGAQMGNNQVQLNKAINEAVGPLSKQETQLQMIVTFMAANSKMNAEQKKFYNDLLNKISYDYLHNALRDTTENGDKRSLNALIRNKQVDEDATKITGLSWDGGKHPAQVRYFTLKDRSLDLSKVDLYSEGSNPCRSKVLRVPTASDAVVEVCESHLNSDKRLEFIVIRNSE